MLIAIAQHLKMWFTSSEVQSTMELVLSLAE